MTADKDFLHWVADRFVYKYGESEHVDFVQKLRSIAETLPPEQDTNGFLHQRLKGEAK